ncbi:MAG: hypothetical protein K2K91_01600 [Ruminococcus sp.]|nr:hypothetical protein [Ruminococcus sp.]
MKCPFCNEDMTHGFLYSSQAVGFPWYPDSENPTKYIPEFRLEKKSSIIFGKTKFEPFEFDTLSFYVCKKYMKGVADSLTEK